MTNKRIDNYSIMISSKYFERIDDFINLEIAVKRFEGNMERFHFNPIPLNDFSRKFFTNLETLHLYDENDQIFNEGKIFKECIWYEVNYQSYLKEKEKGNDCKLICFRREDRIKYGNDIPNNVKILGEYCFNKSNLKNVIIPQSIIKLSTGCFYNCSLLTSIQLTTSLKSIGNNCFYDCVSLTSIEIPFSITYIGCECFCDCKLLKSITIPPLVSQLSYCCFSFCDSLTSIEIPSSVTFIGFCCFNCCTSLKQITLPESIQFMDYSCFYGCESIQSNIEIPQKCFEEPLWV